MSVAHKWAQLICSVGVYKHCVPNGTLSAFWTLIFTVNVEMTNST
jgi:hypothetical protein